MSNTFMEKIFCFLKWKHNDKINFFDSLLPSHRFIQCLPFFFNTCFYSGLSNLQLSWWIFSKSKHSKNHSILVINAGCVEGWHLFGSIKVAPFAIIWFSFLSIFVAAQEQGRGRAEREPRISIPVPAVPVSELLAGKSQRICNSLNWFKGVTFTFWIKIYRKNIFPKINSKIYKFSGFFLPEVPIPALPEPESKFLVPSLLAP